MIWWLWIVLGLILLGAEVLTPGGFYILFFGFSALIVGAMGGLQWVQAEWLQWLLFSGLSIASLLIFRGPLRRFMTAEDATAPAIDTMIGESVLPLEDIAPNAIGKAECRGATWTARNGGSTVLAKGQRSRVDKVDGLTLWVTPESF